MRIVGLILGRGSPETIPLPFQPDWNGRRIMSVVEKLIFIQGIGYLRSMMSIVCIDRCQLLRLEFSSPSSESPSPCRLASAPRRQ